MRARAPAVVPALRSATHACMDLERVVIDTERVIAEVRARPAIWDPSHELYKSREARVAAWSELSRSIVAELDDLHRLDQREIEKKIQQRWRTARDCFVKARAHLLGGGGGAGRGGTERTYGYYDAMTFLEPTLRLPLKVQKTIAHPLVHSTSASRGDKRALSDRGRADRKRCKLEHAPSGSAPAPSETEQELSPLERRLVALVRPQEGPLAEDDDNFFKSLAPMLRAFDTHQKLVFRSRVLALALEVQSGVAGHFLAVEEEHCAPESEGEALETKYQPSPTPLHSD